MTLFNEVKNRLARVLDSSLDQYPGIDLSDADKVEILSSWDDEVFETCASVQEIFTAIVNDMINGDRIALELEVIQERYAGPLSVGQLRGFIIAMERKIDEYYMVELAVRAKLANLNRVLRELDEGFWFEIFYNIHGSSFFS